MKPIDGGYRVQGSSYVGTNLSTRVIHTGGRISVFPFVCDVV